MTQPISLRYLRVTTPFHTQKNSHAIIGVPSTFALVWIAVDVVIQDSNTKAGTIISNQIY